METALVVLTVIFALVSFVNWIDSDCPFNNAVTCATAYRKSRLYFLLMIAGIIILGLLNEFKP